MKLIINSIKINRVRTPHLPSEFFTALVEIENENKGYCVSTIGTIVSLCEKYHIKSLSMKIAWAGIGGKVLEEFFNYNE